VIKKIGSKLVYRDQWMVLKQDKVLFPDGHEGTYAVVNRLDGAMVLIINQYHELLLVKQFRYPTGHFSWELPGGGIDESEEVEDSLRREVKEETGQELGELVAIGKFYPLSSQSTEKEYVFLARVDDIEVKEPEDENEAIVECRVVTIEAAIEMVEKGEIDDPVTAVAIFMGKRYLEKKG